MLYKTRRNPIYPSYGNLKASTSQHIVKIVTHHHYFIRFPSLLITWACHGLTNTLETWLMWLLLLKLPPTVHSDWKNRSTFLTPQKCFLGINYHKWTWENAFWPFLAPPEPWGVSGGWGSVGPKLSTFRGATFGLQNLNFFIELKTLYFPGFWPKTAPQETKNGLFLGWNGCTQKCIFLKNTLFKMPENAP